MISRTLHDAIRSVLLRLQSRTATTSEISAEIEQQGLWFRPTDGKSPKPSQISARVRNYPALFEIVTPGLVRLIVG